MTPPRDILTTTTSPAPPRRPAVVEIAWPAIVSPHKARDGMTGVVNGTAGDARLVARVALDDEADAAATVDLRLEGPAGSVTIWTARRVRCRLDVGSEWSSLDLADEDGALAALSWSRCGAPRYVQSRLPDIAGLAPGSLEPPALRHEPSRAPQT